MEILNTITTENTTHTTSSNAPVDWLTVKLAGHWAWNSVKIVTSVCTRNKTNVSPQRNGTQLPPSNAQINVLITDQTLMETSLIQLTPDNTSLAGRELLLDVSLVQETCNSTKKRTLVSTKENTSLSQSVAQFINLFNTYLENWKYPFSY